ncbi:uncharacterized protein LOC112494193 [Cephus cinctus]|uniref:Uncharacterized protein LOC112494193 n=1 Tax=Cephus cinctus TaxID=211228 RepID=A0AAJ7W0A3_CEPCN|nr:uncharacterized protein LOC112494193 [Cephus cinctus]
MTRRSPSSQENWRSMSSRHKNKHGRRYALSTRAQAVLSTVLEDILEKMLDDAKKIAEDAGKGRMSLEDIEKALKRLCQWFHPQGSIAAKDNKLHKQSNK